MLAPEHRVVLLDQLRPPQGYELDAAVATTFTLGLEAALVPPLAFAAGTLRSSTDPMTVLAAVRQCTARVDVFAQAGMVAVPRRASDLFAFLEPMVHEVAAPPGGLFHPKLWLLRYRAPGQPDAYRLLVLSRNLTDDHSWDLALRLDGRRQGRPMAANRPLAALLRSLPAVATVPLPPSRVDRVLALAEDARHVVWDAPDDVWEIAFHVFGVTGERPAPDLSGYRHLVVSPFLDSNGLELFQARSSEITVVSRPEALDRLPQSALDALAQTFIVSAVAPEAEASGGTASEAPAALLDGLHAKLYVAERNRRAHVFLGSANATGAAFSRNVEVLVELVAGASKFGVDRFLADDGSLNALLESYAATGDEQADPDDDAQWQLENDLRRAATQTWTVHVAREADRWRLYVSSERALDLQGVRASLELLTRPGVARTLADGAVATIDFDGVPLVEITPFLVLQLSDDAGREVSCVLRAVLEGDPAGRLDAVLAAQIDTPEKFLRFLALLLGLLEGTLLPAAATALAGSGGGRRTGAGAGVFETLVRALAVKPSLLDDVARLVSQLQATEQGRAVLPAGFGELWTVVEKGRRALEVEQA